MPLHRRAAAHPPDSSRTGSRRSATVVRLLAVLVAAAVAVPLLGPGSSSAGPLVTANYGTPTTSAPSYPIPSGARFVAPWGNDANPGTSGSPYRTLQRAVDASPSGSTLVLRGGVYRESVAWYGKTFTIQNHPGEIVHLSGSDVVTGWVADGSAWRVDNWNHRFKRDSHPDLVSPEYPLAAWPDQVFNNGVPMTQVASRSAVKPGTFFVDYTNRRLFIGSNPHGRGIEASTRTRGLHLMHAHGSTIRGITVQRYANHVSDYGAVFLDSARVTLENVVIRQNSSVGASIFHPDGRVLRSTFADNGQIGLQAHQAHNLTVSRNALIRNNSRNFIPGGTALGAQGGSKITRSNKVRVYDNMVEANRGHGLWVDEDSYDIHYIRNIVRFNGGVGMQVEISGRAIVASNLVAHNGGVGLNVTETADIEIYNNSFHRNVGRHIYLLENNRKSSNTAIPRDLRNVVVRNNIFNESPGDTPVLLGVEDVTRTRNGHQLGVSLNHNAYRRTESSSPRWWTGWANYPHAFYNSNSLQEFRDRTGQERNGWMVQSAGDPFFVNPDGNDFGLKAKSTYVGVGLPSSVAAALGLPAGHRPPVGALHLG